MPWPDARAVLEAELGPAWRQRFVTFDRRPAAAASIGQVHRACWRDGTPDGRAVAVKIQYPGVREAILADVRMLSVTTRVAALVARGMALPPLVAELRTRLLEELDYTREAANQRAFHAAYTRSASPAAEEAVVPAVVHATTRVLVQDWLGGVPLVQIAATGSASDRDRLALLYQRFLLSGPARCGLLHTDPHPGNFRLMPDGRLGALDFGSCLALPGGLPRTFGRLIGALLAGDDADVLAALTEEGLLRPGAQIEVGKLRDYLAPFSEPARHDRFTYSRAWLRSQFGRLNDPRNPDFAVALQLTIPPEQLFTHRVWLGIVGVLCQLEASVPGPPRAAPLAARLPAVVTAQSQAPAEAARPGRCPNRHCPAAYRRPAGQLRPRAATRAATPDAAGRPWHRPSCPAPGGTNRSAPSPRPWPMPCAPALRSP